jgi:uncharacterized membrane protein HdeD (DUF308 family)
MATEPSDQSLVEKGATAAKPWRRGIPWWLVLIEGLILLASGLYGLIAPNGGGRVLGWALILTLAVIGLLELIAALRMHEAGRARQATLIQGLVGLVIGGLLVVLDLTNVLDLGGGLIVLGLGLLVFGLLGLYRYLAHRESHLPSGGWVLAVVLIVAGVLVLLAEAGVGHGTTYVRIVSILLIVCGVALLSSAFVIRRRGGGLPVEKSRRYVVGQTHSSTCSNTIQ